MHGDCDGRRRTPIVFVRLRCVLTRRLDGCCVRAAASGALGHSVAVGGAPCHIVAPRRHTHVCGTGCASAARAEHGPCRTAAIHRRRWRHTREVRPRVPPPFQPHWHSCPRVCYAARRSCSPHRRSRCALRRAGRRIRGECRIGARVGHGGGRRAPRHQPCVCVAAAVVVVVRRAAGGVAPPSCRQPPPAGQHVRVRRMHALCGRGLHTIVTARRRAQRASSTACRCACPPVRP